MFPAVIRACSGEAAIAEPVPGPTTARLDVPSGDPRLFGRHEVERGPAGWG